MNVSPGEKLTRFIRYNSHFSDVTNRVKPDVFLPHRKSIEISVFRITGCNDSEEPLKNEIWKIGLDYVQTEERPIIARADLSTAIVYENKLKVIPDEPPPRHANITPFPVEETPTDRKARRAIATKLAHASKLVVLPENV